MKKIIFDLDSTLLTISEEWINYYQKFIDKYKFNISPKELYSGIGDFEKDSKGIIVKPEYFCNYLNNKLSIQMTEEILMDFLNYYLEIPLLDLELINDILKYLSQKYELIVYSNWFTFNQIERLKKHHIFHLFSEIHGWDVLPTKPSEDGIKSIVKTNSIKDYYFVGDNIETDLEIPYSMGMNTCFYNRKNVKQNKYKEIYNIEDLKKVF